MNLGNRESTPLLFDTLAYSQGLQQHGIEHSEIFSALLAEVLSQNIYTKFEVKNMLEDTMKEFQALTLSIKEESRKERERITKESQKEIHRMELEMERIYTRTVTFIVGILGSLIVIVGVISTFAHTIFH